MKYVIWVFRLGAISNWIVTIGGIVAPRRIILEFNNIQAYLPVDWQGTIPTMNNPFLVIIWSGMAFLWGVLMWEISLDPIKNFKMIKYTYIEKMITFGSISWAFFLDKSTPMIVLLLVIYTDLFWLILFIIAELKLKKIRIQA